MSSAIRPSKTESRLDYEVNQASHGFSVGTILTHTGSAYATALSTDEIVGVVSEVQDTNNFTIQTHGRITGLSSLTAGSQYYVSSSSAGTATTTDTDTPIYIAVSTTEAVINTYIEGAGGGGSADMVLISTSTASSSTSIDFTNIDSTYRSYMVVYDDVQPTTDATSFYFRMSSDNGSSYLSSGYRYGIGYAIDTAQEGPQGSQSASEVLLFGNAGNASGEYISGKVFIYNPSATNPTRINFENSGVDNTAQEVARHAGARQTSSVAIDAIRFIFSSGNISTGTFKLYGIK